MAAKKKTGKSKKTPAVRYLRYELTNSGSAGTETSHYIDLARDLSAINRRLYRQGRDYHIRKVTVVSKNTDNVTTGASAGTSGGRFSISTVPDSWSARNAWKRGFKIWQSQRKMVAKDTNIKPGKFDDFKVYLSLESKAATPLKPKDNGGNDLLLGEWEYATLFSPDGTTSADPFKLHMLGDHDGSAGSWNSVALIKSYGESRVTVNIETPNQPATTSADPLVNVHDDGTVFDEVVENMENANDASPYDLTTYPGAQGNMPKPIVVQDGCLSDGRLVLGGFNAVCGLLELETTSPNNSDVYSVLVEIAPGNYRGVAGEVI